MDTNKQKEVIQKVKEICKKNKIGVFMLTDGMMTHIQTEDGKKLSQEQVETLKERLIESFYEMYLDYLSALSLDLGHEEL
jgi:DNA-binding transcriptional regulator YbjK